MRYESGGKEDDLRYEFWEAMAGSSFLFLQLDGDSKTAVPMTAQIDRNADSSIWFFSQKNSDFAQLGNVTATFAGKDHKMFARFHGTLEVETSLERFDHFWNNFVKAWYDGGKTDPDLLFLRMDLGDAELWSGDMGIVTVAKMALGKTVHDEAEKGHVETTL